MMIILMFVSIAAMKVIVSVNENEPIYMEFKRDTEGGEGGSTFFSQRFLEYGLTYKGPL